MKSRFSVFLALVSILSVISAMAANEKITPGGPLIKGYGPHFTTDQDEALDKSAVFKITFDLARQGEKDSANRHIESLARFLNMHVAYGIPVENMHLALVVHGSATFDMLNNEAYNEKYGVDNPNHDLLARLMENNVEVFVCGQSAGFMNVNAGDLQSGAKMSISAMTAHALLQQQGYTLNPF